MAQTTGTPPSTRPPGLLSAIGTLARNDARLIGRDSFLPSLFLITIGISVLLRFGLPWLGDLFEANPDLGIGRTELFPLFVGYAVMYQGAVLGGVMIAFILLDERDDRTMDALLVTPMPTSHYLSYRLLVAIAITFVMILALVYIVDQALVPLWQLLPIVAVASLMGALNELFLATFAGNKVEGFAQMKILGTVGLLLVVAWFVPMPWELLVGLYPPYWAIKAYWLAQAGDPNWWLALLVGAVLMSATLAYLMRRFSRVVHR
jgi:fluoroquinolone transport system permease protein